MIICVADVFSLQRAIRWVLIYVSVLNTGEVKESSVGCVPFYMLRAQEAEQGLGLLFRTVTERIVSREQLTLHHRVVKGRHSWRKSYNYSY
jgi:hypothetical protein